MTPPADATPQTIAARRNRSWVVYRTVRAVLEVFCRLFWRMRVDGAEHIPATGAFVLAPVHRSNVDSPVVAAAVRRPMHFMGKASMWKYDLPGRFFTALGGFPVDRGAADRDAMRRCLDELAKGEPVVMFPEGTRQSGPIVETMYDGPAYVAARAGCPIIPVGIGGSERAMPKGAKYLRPGRIDIVIGPPIGPPAATEGGRTSRSAVRATTEALKAEIQRLFDAAQARAGAG